MPAFRFGALRDLFGKSDESKPGKGEQAVTKLQALQEAARAAGAAPPEAEAVKQATPASPDVTNVTKQEAKEKVVRAVRKPADSSESYTAADIEVLEGLEPVRRRPGMYVGGTDEKALHHLFAEVIDNCMDEAVAGHATWIEVRVEEDGFLSVTDNGRGIPVDPHPKFKNKSALEVIMTTLHSGGKFDSKVYNTSGGLHGVGISVVNALSEKLEVEVARGQQLYAMDFSRGAPLGKLKSLGATKNRRGTKIRFKPDDKIFGKGATFKPARLLRMARSKAYLFGGVEIRWFCAPALITDDTPAEAVFHFPGGLKDYLEANIEGQTRVTKDIFAGRVEKEGGHGSVEWAVCWVADEDGFLNSYCNTIPTAEGGTHESGFRSALGKALRDFGERVANKRAVNVTAEDVLGTAAAMLSVFIREPEFQGQTKDKLATQEAARIVESTVRDAFDHWLVDIPAAGDQAAGVGRRPGRGAAQAQAREGDRPPDRHAQAAAAGQARRLQPQLQDRHRDLHRRGRLGRRLRQAGARPRAPGRAAAARQDPQRRQRFVSEAVAEPAAVGPDPGAGRRHRHSLSRRGPALRARDHHDGRRRRRRPHRLAADHVLLPGDARADRAGPSVPGDAAALQAGARRQVVLRPRRQAQGRADQARVSRPTPRWRSAASRAWAR